MPIAACKARDQVIELLKEDHKHVKRHFREFEKMDAQQEPAILARLAPLVRRVCDELQVHAAIEEELFYPAARAALHGRPAQALIDEAEVEHRSAKMLVAELHSLAPEDPKFKANFIVLSEYVKHHVKEEEADLFEELGRVKVDWEPLLQDMLDRQQELRAERGLSDAGEPEVQAPVHPVAQRTARPSARSHKAC